MADTSWLANGGAAAIVGALAGSVVGGTITGGVQWLVLQNAAKQRDQALARSLLFKMGRIHSHLRKIHEHIEEAFAKADPRDHSNPSTFVQGVANTPDRVSFSADEMGLVLQISGGEVFNELAMRDELHNATLGWLDFYHERRREFLDRLAPVEMEGIVATVQIDASAKRRVLELNDSIVQLRANLGPDAALTGALLERLGKDFNAKLNLGYTLAPKGSVTA